MVSAVVANKSRGHQFRSYQMVGTDEPDLNCRN